MIVLLNPVFNCSKSLLSFSADKVTTGTYNVQSVILNAALLENHLYLADLQANFKVKDTSQLTNNIFKLFQKLPRCFNGTAVSTSFVPLLF